MEDTSVVQDVYLNNGDIEWQPLSLTLVEYPKGIYLDEYMFDEHK